MLLGTDAAGMTSGFSNFCANLGGLTFAYALGAVKDSTGSFDAGLYALTGLCLVGLAATAALSRVTRRTGVAPAAAPAYSHPPRP